MADLYRRCGCRRPDGKSFPPLPDRPTDAQRAASCPLMADPKHGSWGFVAYGGSEPGTGKRIRERRSGFATKREAQQERARVIDQVASGRYRGDRRITVGEYLPKWLERRVKDGLRPSTALMYRRYIDLDLVPSIGRIRLLDLRRHHVDQLVQDLLDAGRGATTVRRIHAVLPSALTAAEKLDLVEENAASRIALPTARAQRRTMWEPEQVGRLLDIAGTVRIGPIYELAVLTGLRGGELVGMKWADVDLPRRELIVRQQRVQVGSRVVEGRTKTESSQHRRVALGDEAVGALMAWKLTQDAERDAWSEAWHDGGWVFTREDGQPLLPQYVSRTFEALVERAGLPAQTFHALRHHYASLSIAAGVPLVVISKRLGHSTLAVTSDMYSHLLQDANRDAADAVEGIVGASRIRKGHTLATQGRAGALPEEVTGPASQ